MAYVPGLGNYIRRFLFFFLPFAPPHRPECPGFGVEDENHLKSLLFFTSPLHWVVLVLVVFVLLQRFLFPPLLLAPSELLDTSRGAFSWVGFMTILSKGNDFFIQGSIFLIIDREEKAWAQISEDKTVVLQSQQGLKIIHHKKETKKKKHTAVSDHINKGAEQKPILVWIMLFILSAAISRFLGFLQRIRVDLL